MFCSHTFIFKEGVWIGEGNISFSFTQDHLHFYTKWIAEPENNGILHLTQNVEMQGFNQKVSNSYKIFDLHPNKFQIELENDIVGKVLGSGVIESKTIAWEFQGYSHFEGFEVWELQNNGDYRQHSEYYTEDQFRTIIDGKIWKKTGSK